MSTVTAFNCFYIRLFGTSDQKPGGSIFEYLMFLKRLVIRVTLAPDKVYDSDMQTRTYAIPLCRYDLRIYDGSTEQYEVFARRNEVTRDLWHCTLRLSFIILARLL